MADVYCQKAQGKPKLQPIGSSNLSKPFDTSKLKRHDDRQPDDSFNRDMLASSRYKPDLVYDSELNDNDTVQSDFDREYHIPTMVNRATGNNMAAMNSEKKMAAVNTEKGIATMNADKNMAAMNAQKMKTEGRDAPFNSSVQKGSHSMSKFATLRRSLQTSNEALYRISKFNRDHILSQS